MVVQKVNNLRRWESGTEGDGQAWCWKWPEAAGWVLLRVTEARGRRPHVTRVQREEDQCPTKNRVFW